MIRAISPTTSIHSQPREITESPKDTLTSKAPEKPEMTIEELIKLSMKEIMDLASSRNPPSLLAGRDKETVKEANMILESIKGYKPPRQ